MAEFNVALKAFMSGLDLVADPTGKYMMVTDANGNVVGKMRSNAIVFQEDLVDLGLPSGTLWAKKNIGAALETDYGMFFSWGNPDGHNIDGVGNYNFSADVYATTPGAALTTDIPPAQDAATANLGAAWRTPTTDNFAELFNSNYTTNEWTYIENAAGTKIYGRRVTSKSNGNSIFFPAAGYFNGTSLNYRGSSGFYWSSTRIGGTTARNLGFSSSGVNPQDNYSRRLGFSVRAVQ